MSFSIALVAVKQILHSHFSILLYSALYAVLRFIAQAVHDVIIVRLLCFQSKQAFVIVISDFCNFKKETQKF